MTAPRVERLDDRGVVSLMFFCPGCRIHHAPVVERPAGASGPLWTWNGSLELPTFSPSLVVKWEWEGVAANCHSFIRDGRIQFLEDCTHALSGQTMDLPEVE